MVNTHLIGQAAEDIAAEYLLEQKVKIIGRNFRTRFGEIDIIGKKGKKFIFFEVKAKTTSAYGYPHEMVTSKKKKKLIATAKNYLIESGLQIEEVDWQIDVISINYESGELEWLKNAVQDD